MDTKAWALEDHLQKLLKDCLQERRTRPTTSAAQTVAGSTSSLAGDLASASTANSVNGMQLDTASQCSATGNSGVDLLRRRQLYAQLRSTLMHLIMPLDEKNHVLANANEELARHTRRQDEIWPHIADEISEEARLGSLKHWALTDLNPSKKTQAANARGREAAASLAMMHDDIAERSERRREAIQAKKQRIALPPDSDIEDRGVRKVTTGKGKKVAELAAEILQQQLSQQQQPPLQQKGKGKRPEKQPVGTAGMERQVSKTGVGAVSMSREPSQQESSKKRKAPTTAMTVARKRYVASAKFSGEVLTVISRVNATTQESPKLASAPVSGTFKDAVKRSPALTGSKPGNSRGRQVSAAQTNGVGSRPSTSTKAFDSPRLAQVELVNSNSNSDHVDGRSQNKIGGIERDSNDTPISARGGIALERSASKQSQLKREARADSTSRRTASPRLTAALPVEQIKVEKSSKSRIPKVSTPLLGSFTDVDAADSAPDTASAAENGTDLAPRGTNSKTKRVAKPRMKDHHGLQDSLSPKALPPKRTHKKNSSYSLTAAVSMSRSNTRDAREEEVVEGKKAPSRANSRSTKGANDRNNDERPTPTGDAQDEAELGVESSRRNTVTRGRVLDVKPPNKTALEESPVDSTENSNGVAAGRSTRASHIHERSSSPAQPDADENETSILDKDDKEDLDEEEDEPNPSQLSTQELSLTTLDQPLPPPTTRPSPPIPPTIPAPTNTTTNTTISNTATNPQTNPSNLNSPSPSDHDSDMDVDADPDTDEQRYCYCNQISYGEMVACDNSACAREWFHLACTELRSLPSGRMTWYCEQCRK